jgi:hypothetical protein
MTEQKKYDPKKTNGADDLADHLVPDPANPDVRRLVGFLLGKSHRDGYWRLYLNSDLTHYIEFSKEDTVHAKQVGPNRTMVWVKPQTRVQVYQTASVPVEFLKGDVLKDAMGGAGQSGFGRTMMAMAGASGCAHCQQTPSCPCHPGTGVSGGADTAGFSCGC